MPRRSLALEPEAPKRLEIEWKGGWKQLEMRLDGEPIGSIPTRTELQAGKSFTLPDGRELSIRLKTDIVAAALEVLIDGEPAPGSDTDPAAVVRSSAQLLYVLAGLNAVAGLLVLVMELEWLAAVTGEYGIGAFIMALVFSVLAYFTMGGSFIALSLAIFFFALDGIGTLASGSGGGIIVRIFLILLLARGVPAAWKLRRQRRATRAAKTTGPSGS